MTANKFSRFIKGLLLGAVGLLLCGAVYVAVTLLESPEAMPRDSFRVVEEDPILSPLQASSSGNVQALASLFGAPLPALPGLAVSGEARNLSHDGRTVYQVTLRYSGASVTAVRPASAAPLLLLEDYAVSLRSDITVANLPGVLAEKDGQYCLYFSNDYAAYRLTASAENADAFLRLADMLRFVQ